MQPAVIVKSKSRRPAEYKAGIHNIDNVIRNATPSQISRGIRWYSWYQHECIRTIGLVLESSVGIASAWSVQRSPANALRQIVAYLNDGRIGHFGRIIGQVEAIRNGADPLEILTGDKVRSFYACLLDPENPSDVAIDGHAWCAYIGERIATSSVRVPKAGSARHNACKDAYRIVADRHDLTPSQCQAIAWVAWRETYQAHNALAHLPDSTPDY